MQPAQCACKLLLTTHCLMHTVHIVHSPAVGSLGSAHSGTAVHDASHQGICQTPASSSTHRSLHNANV
jgi:hypothetical protein